MEDKNYVAMLAAIELISDVPMYESRAYKCVMAYVDSRVRSEIESFAEEIKDIQYIDDLGVRELGESYGYEIDSVLSKRLGPTPEEIAEMQLGHKL